MGMDVYGKNARSETGKYFRANIWGWHPLASFCEKVAPDITCNIKYFHSNDGDGLNDQDSRALALRLRDVLEGPCGGRLQKTVDRGIEGWPSPQRVLEFADFLSDCGGFEIF